MSRLCQVSGYFRDLYEKGALFQQRDGAEFIISRPRFELSAFRDIIDYVLGRHSAIANNSDKVDLSGRSYTEVALLYKVARFLEIPQLETLFQHHLKNTCATTDEIQFLLSSFPVEDPSVRIIINRLAKYFLSFELVIDTRLCYAMYFWIDKLRNRNFRAAFDNEVRKQREQQREPRKPPPCVRGGCCIHRWSGGSHDDLDLLNQGEFERERPPADPRRSGQRHNESISPPLNRSSRRQSFDASFDRDSDRFLNAQDIPSSDPRDQIPHHRACRSNTSNTRENSIKRNDSNHSYTSDHSRYTKKSHHYEPGLSFEENSYSESVKIHRTHARDERTVMVAEKKRQRYTRRQRCSVIGLFCCLAI